MYATGSLLNKGFNTNVAYADRTLTGPGSAQTTQRAK